MKVLSILLLSFMVWKDPVHAFPFILDTFCETILKESASTKNNQYQSCVENSLKHPKYNSASLIFICLDSRAMVDQSPTEASQYCNGEMAKLDTVDVSKENLAIENIYTPLNTPSPDKGIAEIVPQVSSKQLNECQTKDFLNKYNECNIGNATMAVSLESISDILKFTAPGSNNLVNANPVYSAEDCKCLDQKIKTDYKDFRNNLTQDLKKERDRINGLIFHAAGRKFLNSYASNMEDVRYYLTNKFNLLGASESEAAKLQCNDAAGFQETIQGTCSTNGVPKEIYEKRTKALLGSLGDDMSSPTLEGKFKKIDEFILNIKPDAKDLEVGPQMTFSRTEYDMFRNGASKKSPEVSFINSMINSVLNHPKLKNDFEEHLRQGLNPGHALSSVIQDEKSPEVQSLMNNIIRDNKNSAIFKKLQGTLKTASAEDYPEFIRNTYKIAIGAHPGLKAILTDNQLFNEIKNKRLMAYDKKDPSLVDLLEQDSSLLQKHFVGRCQKMRKNLAEAVCTPDEDYIKRVKREDINKLMSQIDGRSNLPLKDLLLCQMPEVEPKGVFKKLSFGYSDWLLRSDYFNRKLNPIAQQDNGFSGIYRAMNQNQNSRSSGLLSTIFGLTKEARVSSSEIAKEISNQGNSSLGNLAESAKSFFKQDSSIANKISDALHAPMESNAPIENYSLPASSAIIPTSIPENSSPKESKVMRNKLKDYLADQNNEKEVEKLMSNTRDEDIKELLRIKDEIAKDQEKITKLMRENDRAKVKSLEESYQALEKKYKEASQPKVAAKAPLEEYISDEPEVRNYGSSTGSYSSGGTDGGRDGSRYSDSSPTAGRASTSGSGGGRSLASAARVANDNSANSKSSETSRGEIIIESNAIKSSDKTTESAQINSEIISFVNQHETDITTLQKLKEKGMIFKFKIIENGFEVEKEMKVDYLSMSVEAKQILDKKIAYQGIRVGQSQNLEHEVLKARRAYSFSALKMILGIQASKSNTP